MGNCAVMSSDGAGRRETTEDVYSHLYGRRKGKKLRPRHNQLLEDLLPRVAIDIAQPMVDLAGLFVSEAFSCELDTGSHEENASGQVPEAPFRFDRNGQSSRPQNIRLEIGFGGGEHLLAQALAHPDIGFLGCEPFVPGIAKALAGIEAEGIENLRIFQGDAALLIAALPASCLDRVYLLYPDPWPKRRQRKRRFLSDSMLVDLARVMRSGAELRFATDIDDYAGWTLARILRSQNFAWPARSAQDWQKPWNDWGSTRYEEKALSAGRSPAYFNFVRI
jgi:tRNA (guanine-N7-)-methyltransferase